MSDRERKHCLDRMPRTEATDGEEDKNSSWLSMDSPATLLILSLLCVIVILLTIFVMCYAYKRHRRRSRRDHERSIYTVCNRAPPIDYPNGYIPGTFQNATVVNGCQMCNPQHPCTLGPPVGMPGHRVANRTHLQHQHPLTQFGDHGIGNYGDRSDNGRGRIYTGSEHTGSRVNDRRPRVVEGYVMNPSFIEEFENDSSSRSANENNCINERLEELYKITERSFTQIVQDKQVVSIARNVGSDGETLFLDNMGIKLIVPRGAVKEGEYKLITLVLNWDLSDNPDMKRDESLVSPVVYVGPHGLKLRKPCILTFRHCAFDPRQIKVMRSETELVNEKKWQPVCGQDDVTRLSSEECNIDIDTFTLYTCIQAPIDDRVGKKWLQIAMFACPLRRNINHHQVRVYFLNKTPCALQWAIQHEAEFGGKLVCPEKVFLFDGRELDMLAKIRYISDGWQLVESDYIEKISFIKIWHGHCPHISVCFKRSTISGDQSTHTTVAIEMSLLMHTYQNSMETDGEKLVVHISEDNVSPCNVNEPVCARHHLDELVIDVNQSDNHNGNNNHAQGQYQMSRPYVESMSHVFDGSAVTGVAANRAIGNSGGTTDSGATGATGTTGTSGGAKLHVVVNTTNRDSGASLQDMGVYIPKREIPQVIRRKLQCLLDPEMTSEHDWRDFAEKLECDQFIPILREKSHRQSPTDALLDVVEHRDMSLTELEAIFRSIDREDCASIINQFLCTNVKQRMPAENSGYQLYRGENSGHSGIRADNGREHSWNIYPESGVGLSSGSGIGGNYSREGGGNRVNSSREDRQRDTRGRDTAEEFSMVHGVKHYHDNRHYP